jgi:hypothetical protein
MRIRYIFFPLSIYDPMIQILTQQVTVWLEVIVGFKIICFLNEWNQEFHEGVCLCFYLIAQFIVFMYLSTYIFFIRDIYFYLFSVKSVLKPLSQCKFFLFSFRIGICCVLKHSLYNTLFKIFLFLRERNVSVSHFLKKN